MDESYRADGQGKIMRSTLGRFVPYLVPLPQEMESTTLLITLLMMHNTGLHALINQCSNAPIYIFSDSTTTSAQQGILFVNTSWCLPECIHLALMPLCPVLLL
jgi:hypothetical protein